MRRINRCLNHQLAELCHRAVQMDELNLKVTQYLPEQLQPHCRVGSFNKGCLMLLVDKNEWATDLRYCLPELRDALRQKAGVYQLMSIKIQIADQIAGADKTKTRQKSVPSLSEAARDACRNAGELCSYEPLKDVLLHLADSGKRSPDQEKP
ncbi:DciA family protein [Legionella sp. CNM-4043-24]|uniref:DciA family protein n=1 Tax=Legionella sp. CNM-4043-24 TaxID=3421646 RepID=UPI00403B053F